MGEYFMICNLDKKELICPNGFNHGSKPGDFAHNAPRGVLTGLLELLLLGGSARARAERRGHLTGRWAGDRVAIIGDYFDQEVAGTSWSQDEWCAREAGDDGWVNITEDVVRAVRNRYLPDAGPQESVHLRARRLVRRRPTGTSALAAGLRRARLGIGARRPAEPVPVMRNRLRVLRAEQGWTQDRLAGHLGVSRQTINSIETGRFDPSLRLAFALARLFSCRIEDIFTPHGRTGDAGPDTDAGHDTGVP